METIHPSLGSSTSSRSVVKAAQFLLREEEDYGGVDMSESVAVMERAEQVEGARKVVKRGEPSVFPRHGDDGEKCIALMDRKRPGYAEHVEIWVPEN